MSAERRSRRSEKSSLGREKNETFALAKPPERFTQRIENSIILAALWISFLGRTQSPASGTRIDDLASRSRESRHGGSMERAREAGENV